MKNIQRYLAVSFTLLTVFCIPLNICAMEPIEQSRGKSSKSRESMEDLPIGISNTSSESGGELEVSAQHKRILRARSHRLDDIFENLNKQKKFSRLSPEQYEYIKKLQKNIRETNEIIQNMYFGAIPVNLNDINQRMERIENAVPYFG